MSKFKRYNKYIVIKLTDKDEYLSKDEQFDLDLLLLAIALGRSDTGKEPNHYVVVNEAEPYAEQVWQLIQEDWERKLIGGKGNDEK